MNRLVFPYCAASGQLWLATAAGALLTMLAVFIARDAADGAVLGGLIAMRSSQVAVLGWLLSGLFGGVTILAALVLIAMFLFHREVVLTSTSITAPHHWLSFADVTVELSAIRNLTIQGKGRLATLEIDHKRGRVTVPALFLPQPYGLADLEQALRLRLRPSTVRERTEVRADAMFAPTLVPARAFGRRRP